MKEYQLSGEIILDKNRSIELDHAFTISSYSDEIRNINVKSSTDKILVEYIILSDSDQEAESIASLHLSFLANRISFQHNIPIKNTEITGVSYQELNGPNKKMVIRESITLKSTLGIRKTLSGESINRLKEFLKEPLSFQIEEYLMMYRQALSEESIGLKFLLLYRIIEKIIGGRKIDQWIESVEPNVKKVKNRNTKDITIYTYLRHNIHPKQPQFPYKEISNYVSKLVDITKKAIEEKLKVERRKDKQSRINRGSSR